MSTIKGVLRMNMMSKFILALTCWFIGLGQAVQAREQINHVEQKSFDLFEELGGKVGQEGVAGAFVGVHGDVLIVAGGSAFPEGKPWENGPKYFSDGIYVFQRSGDGDFTLLKEEKLSQGIAEGASVGLPQGVLCIGGQSSSSLSEQVVLLAWSNGQLERQEFPQLPVAVKNATAAVIGDRVYLVGGQSESGALDQFLALDLSNKEAGWQELPNFPHPVTGAMAVAQMDGEEVSLHVFGGRAKSTGASRTTFYADVFRFCPSSSKWEEKKPIRLSGGESLPLAVGVAARVGASHVVLLGGDSGTTFNQVEDAISQMEAGDKKAQVLRDSLWVTHPGFNKQILIYNTVTDSWFEGGTWKGSPVAVSSSVWLNGSLLIPGGEIRPATRTPKIHEVRFSVSPVFGWLNYLVLGVYFIGMLLLGFYFMKRESSTDDFFKAGGRIPWWAAGISIFATTLSAITFIAIPAKSYATDWRMFMFNMAIIFIAPVVIRYFLPLFSSI